MLGSFDGLYNLTTIIFVVIFIVRLARRIFIKLRVILRRSVIWIAFVTSLYSILSINSLVVKHNFHLHPNAGRKLFCIDLKGSYFFL